MCDTAEAHRQEQRSRLAIKVILFVIIVLLGAQAVLMQKTRNLQQENHIIACHIDQTLTNGEVIYQCRDAQIVRR